MADNVIVFNVPEVAGAIERLPEQLIPALRRVAERWQLRRQAHLARYPGAVPGSRYRRTGTLGRTWTSSRPTWSASRSGFESRMGNATPYGPFVQDQRRQAKVHRGRWGTVQEEEQSATPELVANLRAAMAEVEQQINGTTR